MASFTMISGGISPSFFTALRDVGLLLPAFLAGLSFAWAGRRLVRRLLGHDHTQRWFRAALASVVFTGVTLIGYWFLDPAIQSGRRSLSQSFADPIGLTANAILISIGGMFVAAMVAVVHAVPFIRRYDVPTYSFRQLKVGDEFRFVEQSISEILTKSDRTHCVIGGLDHPRKTIHVRDLGRAVRRISDESYGILAAYEE